MDNVEKSTPKVIVVMPALTFSCIFRRIYKFSDCWYVHFPFCQYLLDFVHRRASPCQDFVFHQNPTTFCAFHLAISLGVVGFDLEKDIIMFYNIIDKMQSSSLDS